MRKDLLILLLLIFPAFSLLLQKGYFSMHDDMQTLRQYEMHNCFKDGQIPCRWVNDLGYGYGYPLFNYYPPLPYLVGMPFVWLGFHYVTVIKIVGVIGFAFSAFTMYLLGREFWGRRGGLIAATFFTYAPYHSVDFYVRGAMNEFWAMAFYPLIFWSAYKLISTLEKKYIPLTAVSVAGLMLSHNPMLMIFTPVFLVWIVFWWIKFKSLKSFLTLALSGLWAAGLAAFFTLPVTFEQKFVSVWTLTSGYFNYLAHFVPLSRMFLTVRWGFGASGLGQTDYLSYHIGYLQWLVPAVLVLTSLFVKPLKKFRLLIWFLALATLGSLFMMHSKSTFIWQFFKPLEFLQFPWRFLTLSVFVSSFLSGAVILLIGKHKIILISLLTLAILLNANYFRPQHWYPDMTDKDKFSGKSWQLLVTSGIFDYLPLTAPFPPADPAGADLNLTQGRGAFTRLVKKSNLQRYQVDVFSHAAVAEIQTYSFPGWKAYVDGQEVAIDPVRDPLLGRIQVDLTSGSHIVEIRFTNTPIRTFANFASFIAWVVFIGIMVSWIRKSRSGM